MRIWYCWYAPFLIMMAWYKQIIFALPLLAAVIIRFYFRINIVFGNDVNQLIIWLIAGDLSFEYITSTTESVIYSPGSIIGDWTVTGNTDVFVVSILSRYIKVGNYPYGLRYSCFLQVPPVSYFASTTSSVQTSFLSIIGDCYQISFWYAFRFDRYNVKTTEDFKVILDGHIIYTTIPTTSNFVQVTTRSITAASTSISLTFSLTVTDGGHTQYQNINIVAVSLLHFC